MQCQDNQIRTARDTRRGRPQMPPALPYKTTRFASNSPARIRSMIPFVATTPPAFPPRSSSPGSYPTPFTSSASIRPTPNRSASPRTAVAGRDLTKYSCYNCGEKGHLSSECSRPQSPGAIQARRDHRITEITAGKETFSESEQSENEQP
jgi:hypothetical protein